MSENIIPKLDMKAGTSPDLLQENVAKLKELFPEIFTEGKIDFDAFRGTFSQNIDDREERYSFTWHGKSEARRIAQTPSRGTLRPCPEESVNWDTTKNIFIEGDNLEVLKLLQKSYRKKVKMIYIDPPYNTGKDFIYSDKWKDGIDTYLRYTGQVDDDGVRSSANAETSGRYHTNWLNMMYPRLKLARSLLRDDGSIWISIDDNEFEHLKIICKEIFGEESFIASFIWQKRTTRENRRVFSFNHDYIVCFARNKECFQNTRNLLPLSKEVLARYNNPDDDARGPWQSVAITAQAGHATKSQFYTITTPSGRKLDPPSGNCWRYNEKKLAKMIQDHRIWFGAKGKNVPRKKLFLSEARDGLTPHTLWTAEEVGTSDSAKKRLIRLFNGVEIFDTPKPLGLLQRILTIASNKGDLILDFFAGSGSTGDAVMQLNKEDGGNRRHILVQLPEPTGSNDYETIAEITKARLRAASKAIGGERLGQQGELKIDSCDLGFKAFKLSSSNFKPWDIDFDEEKESKQGELNYSLNNAIDNLKPGRSPDDLLYELLLKYGLDLTIPLKSRQILHHTVTVIGGGALIVCLGNKISLEVISGIASLKEELKPEIMRVVFKDSGFEDDEMKTNALLILNQAGIDDIRSL